MDIRCGGGQGKKHFGRDLEKERLWRGRLQEHAASGLSIRAYCRREGFGEALFYWWRREIARRGQQAARDGAKGREGRAKAAVFAEVRVDSAVVAEARETGAIEVLLRGGRSLRVGPGFDHATLLELARVLEAAQC